MDLFWRRCVAMCLVVMVLQVVVPPAQSVAASCRDRGSGAHAPTTGAIFNDPAGSTADQYRILSTIKKNIDGTPAGGVIRIATLKIDTASIVKALVRAHICGVRVRILVPGRAWRDPAVLELREELGTDTARKSWISSCEGACTTTGTQGIMHAKLHLFSKVVGAEDVTMYDSGNFVHTQATARYNDAYQVVGDADVYASARAYFGTLKQNEPTSYPRLTSSAGYRQYYFPEHDDFHHEVLERTRCRTDDARSTVDFAVSIWKRRDVVKALAELEVADCDVKVVVSVAKADRAVLQGLYRHKIPTHVQSMEDGDLTTHDKYLAIRGTHRGRQVRTVYCGSLNVSRFSARVADNVMLRVVDDPTAYRAYHQHFMTMWEQSRPLRRSDIRSASKLDAGAAEALS